MSASLGNDGSVVFYDSDGRRLKTSIQVEDDLRHGIFSEDGKTLFLIGIDTGFVMSLEDSNQWTIRKSIPRHNFFDTVVAEWECLKTTEIDQTELFVIETRRYEGDYFLALDLNGADRSDLLKRSSIYTRLEAARKTIREGSEFVISSDNQSYIELNDDNALTIFEYQSGQWKETGMREFANNLHIKNLTHTGGRIFYSIGSAVIEIQKNGVIANEWRPFSNDAPVGSLAYSEESKKIVASSGNQLIVLNTDSNFNIRKGLCEYLRPLFSNSNIFEMTDTLNSHDRRLCN